jgi:predicted nucleic acid-binding protein
VARYVIDPATLVHLADRRARVNLHHQLVAPNSIRSQSLGLILERVRRGDLSERDAMERHEWMTELKMRLLGDRVSRRTAWRIAVDHEWNTLTDAEYLAVTLLQADALVTVDETMSAKAKGIVPLADLDVLLAE